MKKEKFDVTGMTCSACSSRVEKCVSKLSGAEKVSVNLLTNSMQVEYDENVLREGQIIDAVVKAGYGASVQGAGTTKRETEKGSVEGNRSPVEEQIRNMKMRLIVSFAFLIPLMYVSMGHMVGLPLPAFLEGAENGVSFAFTQFLFCLPVIYVNRKYFIKGYQTLFHLAPNMDSLIAIGSSASLVYGIFAIYRMSYGLANGDMELVHRYYHDLYFESAAMILALITVGKYLETKSKGKTSEAITKLLDLAPKTATVERGGKEMEIPAEQVQAGDIVIVRPGGSIPVDGFITEGSTSVDEAAITGESIPVHKQVNDTVIAATVNKTGFIRFKATRVGEDTTFSQIIRLVEEASSSKAPIAKTADKIAGIFVPTVMGISLVTAIAWLIAGATFEFALSCAICVLVISCPCALGLATPVAIMVGTGKGAENGILIKSGEALETAHNIKSVVLDKTGTITQGKPVVTDIETELSENAFLKIAAGLERGSEHPLAEAILEYARARGIEGEKTEEFLSVPGQGVKGKIDGRWYFAGNSRMMKAQGIALGAYEKRLEAFADEGKTTLVMLPALGVPSPHIYFKPLAESLDESFNVVIVEPFGYGLSDGALTDRTVDNINSEVNVALDTMGIEQCVLLVHSISGVYGLNFVQNYPEKVKGFIAVDNTVYDEELAEAMEMEKKYMLQGIDEFQKIKNSFSSLEEFQTALKTDPDKYGAALPQVSGYTYTESDREEYIQAYSLSNNDTIRSEVNGMDQSLLSIKNKKFPSALPVLTMISSENVQNVPAWETAHRNQLDLESGNHQLYIVNGGHYIWYTNLTQVVQLINEWRMENHF